MIKKKSLLLLIAAGILIIFVITILILRLQTIDTVTDTPDETRSLPTPNLPNSNQSQRLSEDENRLIDKLFTPLSQAQLNALNSLSIRVTSEGGTYKAKEFEIAYSSWLNQFFIRKITNEADVALFEFFDDPILNAIYAQDTLQRFFKIVQFDVDQARSDAENLLIEQRERRQDAFEQN